MKRIAILLLSISLLIIGSTISPLDALQSYTFPQSSTLPALATLPNPFLKEDGTNVETPAEWEQQRVHIKAMLAHYMYGSMPPAPDNLIVEEISSASVYNGEATFKVMLFSMGPGNGVRFHVSMLTPRGDGPFPVIIKNEGRLEQVTALETAETPIDRIIASRGYVIIKYVRTELDDDQADVTGPAELLYPDHDWATIAMWAWGSSRVIDYLETVDLIDMERIVATGQSRGGKAALCAGIYDDRIAITVPNGSGCGGAGCYRYRGPAPLDGLAQGLGASGANVGMVKEFPHWYHERLGDFADTPDRLPFDLHFLRAAIAPRAVLSVDGLADHWANPLGTQITYEGARPVFDFLGVPERLGIYFREGRHGQTADDWATLLDFADYTFFGTMPVSGKQFDQVPFPNLSPAFNWTRPQ